uniref:Rhomboid 5 homolog 1 n=1 Tax=Gallus gallus TaxID=9031 RepID=A0A8V0Z9N9_CHICK
MSEARHDSTSSLQRKKPPWLKLDIPVPMPVSVPEEPVQPTRRQAFLRSVSMPADNSRVPSLPHEVRRPVLQRQTSITQTIKRSWQDGTASLSSTCSVASLGTLPVQYFYPTEQRLALQDPSLGFWLVSLWSSSRVGKSWHGRGGLSSNCWLWCSFFLPLASCLGLIILLTFQDSSVVSSSPLPSCPTLASGSSICIGSDAKLLFSSSSSLHSSQDL